MATYMDKEFICKKDISIIKLNNDTISYKYVLALLNSKLLSFYKTKNSFSAKEDDFTQITLSEGSFLFQKLNTIKQQNATISILEPVQQEGTRSVKRKVEFKIIYI